MTKKKIHLYSSLMDCACGHYNGEVTTTKNHDEVTCEKCLQTVNLCQAVGKQWLDEDAEITPCEDCDYSDDCLVDDTVPEHMVVGEIMRLIDFITDPVKLGVLKKYAEVRSGLAVIDDLSKTFDSEDEKKTLEEFRRQTKEFVERL